MPKTDANPLISVIVVNYNGRRFLEKAITSLKHQTYQSLEIILVDSGSADDSVSYARQNFPNVHIIPSTNRGFGAACNLGVRQAHGHYVFFLNEDMHVPSTFVSGLFTRYQQLKARDPQIGALACSQNRYEGGPAFTVWPGKLDPFGYPGPVRPPHERGGFIPGCPFFIDRALFLKSGGFCEHLFLYGDDTDLSWRLLLMGYHHYSAPDIHLYHFDAASLPGFPPRKIYFFVYATLVGIYNNYSAPVMPFFLGLSAGYALVVIVPGLLIFTSAKMAYGKTVLRALADFVRSMPRLATCRHRTQQQRILSDVAFIRTYVQLAPSLLATRSYRRLRSGGQSSAATTPTTVSTDTTTPT